MTPRVDTEDFLDTQQMDVDAATLMTIQFQRVEAFHELPGSTAIDERTEAVLLGTEAAVVREVRGAMREFVAASAASLSASPAVSRALSQAKEGLVVACAGDSMTADCQSWAEIVRDVARQVRPDLEINNFGRSGDTTMDLIRRMDMILRKRPSLVIVMIGTNDACRNAPFPGRQLLSDAETRANLERLAEIIYDRGAEVVWITPPPALEGVSGSFPVFQEMGIRYSDADVARKAAIVRERPEPVVDLWKNFADHSLDALLLSDGLHLGPLGQVSVAEQVMLEALVVPPAHRNLPMTQEEVQ
jgi:lysophospholipase L1-like esterase